MSVGHLLALLVKENTSAVVVSIRTEHGRVNAYIPEIIDELKKKNTV